MFQDIVVNLNKLCGPAYIYLIFSVFTLIVMLVQMIRSGKFNFSSIVFRAAITYVIVFFLNWLCVKGWTTFAWFLLGWMFVLVLIVLVGALRLADKILSTGKIQSTGKI